MSQSKKGSLAEAVFNTLIGLVIASLATQGICWVYNIPMTWSNNFILTFWMTVISVIRSYYVRRLWNSRFWAPWVARWKARHIDPDLCCCGCNMGKGGDICFHGGCKSAKKHFIESA